MSSLVLFFLLGRLSVAGTLNCCSPTQSSVLIAQNRIAPMYMHINGALFVSVLAGNVWGISGNRCSQSVRAILVAGCVRQGSCWCAEVYGVSDSLSMRSEGFSLSFAIISMCLSSVTRRRFRS